MGGREWRQRENEGEGRRTGEKGEGGREKREKREGRQAEGERGREKREKREGAELLVKVRGTLLSYESLPCTGSKFKAVQAKLDNLCMVAPFCKSRQCA